MSGSLTGLSGPMLRGGLSAGSRLLGPVGLAILLGALLVDQQGRQHLPPPVQPMPPPRPGAGGKGGGAGADGLAPPAVAPGSHGWELSCDGCTGTKVDVTTTHNVCALCGSPGPFNPVGGEVDGVTTEATSITRWERVVQNPPVGGGWARVHDVWHRGAAIDDETGPVGVPGTANPPLPGVNRPSGAGARPGLRAGASDPFDAPEERDRPRRGPVAGVIRGARPGNRGLVARVPTIVVRPIPRPQQNTRRGVPVVPRSTDRPIGGAAPGSVRGNTGVRPVPGVDSPGIPGTGVPPRSGAGAAPRPGSTTRPETGVVAIPDTVAPPRPGVGEIEGTFIAQLTRSLPRVKAQARSATLRAQPQGDIKVAFSIAARFARVIGYNITTELRDLVQALWGNMPDECKKYRMKSQLRGKGWGRRRDPKQPSRVVGRIPTGNPYPSLGRMLEDIANNPGCIQWGPWRDSRGRPRLGAGLGISLNQIEDVAFGALGHAAKKATKKGGFTAGLQFGDGLENSKHAQEMGVNSPVDALLDYLDSTFGWKEGLLTGKLR